MRRMETNGEMYRTWIMSQRIGDAAPKALDNDHIRITLPTATAEINFYAFENRPEIVELRVVRDSDGDSTFFLHFALDDLEHAERLFLEMVEALEQEGAQRITHVLLSCTSALTTSLFASKMNEVAQTLKLGYDFTAMSLDQALAAGDEYAAVMIAPQASYILQQMTEAHPNALVFEIPGKMFGTYDAPGAIRLLMHALRELEAPGDEEVHLKAERDLSDDRRILVITLFSLNGAARLGYRLYDRGRGMVEGAIRKPRLDYNDVGNLVQMLSLGEVNLKTLDAIAVAVPGVTFRGVVDLPIMGVESFDLGMALAERFGLPVYVDNNCNAAAIGCYVSQDEVENLVFYRHAFGHPSGGLGTVIDGRILKGRLNLAGETHYMNAIITFDRPREEALLTAEGLHQITKDICVAATALMSPDAIYVSVDTVDDAQEFEGELREVFGPTYTPQVHVVTDYVERVYMGTLAMALQKLRDPKYRSHGVGGPGPTFNQTH